MSIIGIDAGSSAVKLVQVDSEGKILQKLMRTPKKRILIKKLTKKSSNSQLKSKKSLKQ